MEDVVSFCYKTIKETNIKINQTEVILQQQFRKNEYEEIQKKSKQMKHQRKRILHQSKFKKFNNLK